MLSVFILILVDHQYLNLNSYISYSLDNLSSVPCIIVSLNSSIFSI